MNHFKFNKLYSNPRFGGTWKVMGIKSRCGCTTIINTEKMSEDEYIDFSCEKKVRTVAWDSPFGKEFTEIKTITISKDEYDQLLETKHRMEGLEK